MTERKTPLDVVELHKQISLAHAAETTKVELAPLKQSLVETQTAYQYFADLGHPPDIALGLAALALENILEES